MQVGVVDESETGSFDFLDDLNRINTPPYFSAVRLHMPTGVIHHPVKAAFLQCFEHRGVDVVTAGSIEVVHVAKGEGKIDLANGPFILPFLMTKGAGPYAKVGKEKGAELGAKIQLLYPHTLAVFTMYAYNAKGIGGWDDIKGRKILNGPPRGAATSNSRALAQFFGGAKHGQDYESITVNWNQASAAIVDGTADAAVLTVHFPGPRETRNIAAGAMTMWSLPKDKFESAPAQKLLNKPGSVAYTAPVSFIQEMMGSDWTIMSEDDTFRGMAVTGGDFVNKSMDEELAYQLTKAHIENLESIKTVAPFMATLNYGVIDPKVAGLCGPNPVKFHPGAVRAWEEAGHKIADCAKP